MADPAEPTPAQTPTPPTNKGGYGKRPLWQWILLYVIVGGIIYFAVYYYFFRGTGYNYGNTTTQHSLY